MRKSRKCQIFNLQCTPAHAYTFEHRNRYDDVSYLRIQKNDFNM